MADPSSQIDIAAFGAEGYLEPGFHHWNVESLAFHFVEQINGSITRPRIWTGFGELRDCFGVLGLTVEQWIDGSFTTTKTDPNDLDVANFFDPDQVEALSDNQRALLKTYIGGRITRTLCHCDSYFAIKVNESHPLHADFARMHAYWIETFGTDRTDTPKGIVVTQCAPPSPKKAADENDEAAADTR